MKQKLLQGNLESLYRKKVKDRRVSEDPSLLRTMFNDNISKHKKANQFARKEYRTTSLVAPNSV